ncbi:MAG: RNA polymerase sigma factor [Ruminococcus sp.]|nr:RNA polymerase sigma factor [Ruminococcus sp.]
MALDISEHYDKIYRYCFVRVRNRELAEDITQDAFLRYIEHPQYQSVNKSLQLLYTIAGNLCTDHFRKKQSTELPEDLPEDSDLESSVLSSLTLKQALADLPDTDREMLLLRYMNDVPIGVIADLFGISRFAASRKLRRTVTELREKLGEEEQI